MRMKLQLKGKCLACDALSGVLWQRGGKRKERSQLRSLEFEFHLQFPCDSPSTELSDFCQSARGGNDRECKQILKNTCKDNDVITNVISANQFFASTFSM